MADFLPSTSYGGYDEVEDVSYILRVPDLVVTHVFSYLSYEKISQIRMLCSRFNYMGQQMLNQGFSKLDRYHSQCAKELKAQLPRRESERRLHPLAKHFDILSAVETRLSLLAMTYSKYIDLQLCCFIPGKVIDEAFRVLRIVKSTQDPPRTHELLQELRDLSSMAMEHFDEKIVPDLKKRSGVEVRLSNLANHALSTLSGRSLKVNSSLSVPSGSREQYSKLHSQYKATLASFNTHRRELATCKTELAEMRRAADEQGRKTMQLQQLTAELSSRLAAQNTRVTDQEKRLVEQDKRMAEIEQRLEGVAGRGAGSPVVAAATNVATASNLATSSVTVGNAETSIVGSSYAAKNFASLINEATKEATTGNSSVATSNTTSSKGTTDDATLPPVTTGDAKTSTTAGNTGSITTLTMATICKPTTSKDATSRNTIAAALATTGDSFLKPATANTTAILVNTSSSTKRKAEEETSIEIDGSGDAPLRKKEKV